MEMSLVFFLILFASTLASQTGLPYVTRPYVDRYYAKVGTPIKIPCPIDGDVPLFVSWKKGDEPIYEGLWPRFKLKEDKGFELSIKNLEIGDAGIYSCNAANGNGPLPKPLNFTLHVLEANATLPPPSIPIQPGDERPVFVDSPPGESDVRVQVGESTRLRCRASGKPRPQVTWYRNQVAITTVPGEVEIEGYSLRLLQVVPGDTGNYMCRINNSIGEITFTYSVSIQEKQLRTDDPELLAPFPLNTSVNYGAPASLQCKVKSSLRPRITWLKLTTAGNDSRTWEYGGKHYIQVSNETRGIETEKDSYLNKLVIPSARPEHSGIYVCIGTNDNGGFNMREAHLVVKPGPESMLTKSYEIVNVGEVDSSWEYIFGSPSATLAVIIAIPVVLVLLVTIAVVYGLNKRKQTTGRRRPSSINRHDREASVPLNLNANNGCYAAQYSGSYTKGPLSSNSEPYYSEHLYKPPPYPTAAQQFTTYSQSDGSYRSQLQYQRQYIPDIPDSDSHFSSVSHSKPQYMTDRHYHEREIHSDPTSRISHHQCPPPPPGSYYSGQW